MIISSRPGRVLSVATVTAALALGGLASGATMASAAPAAATTAHARVHPATMMPDTSGKLHNFVTQANTHIRSGPGTNYPIIGMVKLTSEGIADFCFTTGTKVSGDTHWDLVYDPYNRMGGFVSGSLLKNKSQSLGC